MRAGIGFILLILNENLNDIIKIVKLIEDSGVLIDGVTETVKDKIKKTKNIDFLKLYLTFGFIGTTYDFFSNKRYT